jgi:hypothetical protein
MAMAEGGNTFIVNEIVDDTSDNEKRSMARVIN